MVSYNPSRGDVVVNGQCVSVSRARSMVRQLEDAVALAEAHDELDEDVNFNERAIQHLCDPVTPSDGDDDYVLVVDLSVDGDDQSVDTGVFEDVVEDRVLHNRTMRIVKGKVKASNIPTLFEACSGVVSFDVKLKYDT